VKAGFRGPIHATRATVDLAEIVLRDSAKLQVEFAERWNRRHAAEAESEAVAEETDDESFPERLRSAPPRDGPRPPAALRRGGRRPDDEQMRGCDYGDEVEVADGVTAVFHDAGHILGSAIIELRVTDGDESRTIVFSGDLGRDGSPILRDPAADPRRCVVVESTYGNREHATTTRRSTSWWRRSSEVSDDEGVLLVPAFAIGRTQEVIWVLDELVREERIPRVPLYLDSPMASRATASTTTTRRSTTPRRRR
jgi:metallo-beta-lactamase family protein